MITLDPGDERAAEAVDGESTCDVERLRGGNVRFDLRIGDLCEVHKRRRDRRARGYGRAATQDHVVTGVQRCRAATNLLPTPNGFGRRSWLAAADTVNLEQGITSDDERGRRSMINPGIDSLRLELREARGQLSHAARGFWSLVNSRNQDLGMQSGIAQRPEPSFRRGRENKSGPAIHLRSDPSEGSAQRIQSEWP